MYGLSRGVGHRRRVSHRFDSGARALGRVAFSRTRGRVHKAWGRWVVVTCRGAAEAQATIRRSVAASCLQRQSQMLSETALRASFGKWTVHTRVEAGIEGRLKRDEKTHMKTRIRQVSEEPV